MNDSARGGGCVVDDLLGRASLSLPTVLKFGFNSRPVLVSVWAPEVRVVRRVTAPQEEETDHDPDPTCEGEEYRSVPPPPGPTAPCPPPDAPSPLVGVRSGVLAGGGVAGEALVAVRPASS